MWRMKANTILRDSVAATISAIDNGTARLKCQLDDIEASGGNGTMVYDIVKLKLELHAIWRNVFSAMIGGKIE